MWAPVFQLPEPGLSSLLAGFIGIISGDIIRDFTYGLEEKTRKRKRKKKKKKVKMGKKEVSKELVVGVFPDCLVSFCRGKDTQFNGFMHGPERLRDVDGLL